MKKEIFWEGEYQYDLEIENDVYTLWHSNSECWNSSTQNTVALQLINTGNDYKVIGLERKKYDIRTSKSD